MRTQEAASEDTRPAVVQTRDISKHFGGVLALDAVSLSLSPGEVHALVGENGAGKSTLGKIIAGALVPDSGTIVLDGRQFARVDPEEARRSGIEMVHQELNLVPWMSVEDNLFLGREATGHLGSLDRRTMRRRSVDAFAKLGIDIDPTTSVLDLSVAHRQIVEIARAFLAEPHLIIMDEPSAVLGGESLERVLSVVRALRDADVGILYISHRLNEVFEVADLVTVLRDGRCIDTMRVRSTSIEELVRLMVGRDVPRPSRRSVAEHRTHVLGVRGLVCRHGGPANDLDLYSGEVVGIAGMVGSGRSSLVRAISGAAPATNGTFTLDGRDVAIRHPGDAIRQGICLVPEDRKDEGLLRSLSVANNIALPSLGAVSTHGVVDRTRERELAEEQIEVVDIRPPNPEAIVNSLSGGNQQKVVVSKWLARKPRVLILDEPTRGIDVGAKAEIHKTIRALADDGVAVLIVSSELPEILTASDRILVMRDGAIVAELSPDQASEEAVLAYAIGHNGDEGPITTEPGGA